MIQLPRLIEFISLNRGDIPTTRKASIATVLFSTMGSINQSNDGGILARAPVDQATRLAESLLLEIGIDAANQLILRCIDTLKTEDFIALSWFIRDENLVQEEDDGRRAACISQGVFEQLARCYVRAIVDAYPEVLRLPGHPAQFLWRHIDEKLGGSALREVREKYGNDVQLRVLCAGAALAHWQGAGGSGFGYSPSAHQGYEPVLATPSAEEVEGFGRMDEFVLLPEEVRVRVASLYLLLTRGAMGDEAFDDERVAYSTALALVREWEQR